MHDNKKTMTTIRSRVKEIAPDAKVVLFGSRAYGQPNEESDWDLLILTHQPVDRQLKNRIQSGLFPISVDIGAFINILTIQQAEWVSNPAYYTLRQSIKQGMKINA